MPFWLALIALCCGVLALHWRWLARRPRRGRAWRLAVLSAAHLGAKLLLLLWLDARAGDWAEGGGWAALSFFFSGLVGAAALFAAALLSGLIALFRGPGG